MVSVETFFYNPHIFFTVKVYKIIFFVCFCFCLCRVPKVDDLKDEVYEVDTDADQVDEVSSVTFV